jgi:hypothetical protein
MARCHGAHGCAPCPSVRQCRGSSWWPLGDRRWRQQIVTRWFRILPEGPSLDLLKGDLAEGPWGRLQCSEIRDRPRTLAVRQQRTRKVGQQIRDAPRTPIGEPTGWLIGASGRSMGGAWEGLVACIPIWCLPCDHLPEVNLGSPSGALFQGRFNRRPPVVSLASGLPVRYQVSHRCLLIGGNLIRSPCRLHMRPSASISATYGWSRSCRSAFKWPAWSSAPGFWSRNLSIAREATRAMAVYRPTAAKL